MKSDGEIRSEQELTNIFFRHHLWANLGLSDACLALDEEQLNHPMPGTYGTIWNTLIHLVRAEERYLYFLTGEELGSHIDDESQTPITELKDRARQSGLALLQTATTIDPSKEVQVGVGEDAELIPAKVLLLQSIHHAHEHRTQIATIMGHLGIEPPSLSGWRYFDEEMVPTEK